MNKYEKKRRYNKMASLKPGYLVEAYKDYLLYVNPQIDKFPEQMGEYARQIRECQYDLLGMILEAEYCDEGRRWKLLASGVVKLKVITALMRMSAGDLGVRCIAPDVYERVAAMLVKLEDLMIEQMKAITG